MTTATSILTKSFKEKIHLTIVFALLAVSSASLFEEELRGYIDYEEQEETEQNQFEDHRSVKFLGVGSELQNYGNSNQQLMGFCAGKKDGNYINPANPHSFYQCHQNGITQLRSCPSGTVYDPPPRDRCEWPHLVQGCNGRYGNCNDKEAIVVLPTPNPYGKDRTCHDLPQCPSCKPTTVPAYRPPAKGVDPRGYYEPIHFRRLRSVERGYESRYYGRPVVTSSFCSGKSDGNYVNPNNPQSFYQCHQNGATVIQPCPFGTIYDPLPRDRCEWPNEVQGCNSGYGRGCKKSPIVVTEVYPSYPVHTVKPSFPQCNVACKIDVLPRPPVKQPYVQLTKHQTFQHGYSG